MLSSRASVSLCATCRLRTTLYHHRIARLRTFTTARPSLYPRKRIPLTTSDPNSLVPSRPRSPPKLEISSEELVFEARQLYGDDVPQGMLTHEEWKIYERRYGKPAWLVTQAHTEEALRKRDEEEEMGTGVMKEGQEGGLEEIEYVDEVKEDKRAEADRRLQGDILRASISAQRLVESGVNASDAQDERVEDAEEEGEEGGFARVHPLTLANRFGTSPSTIFLPKESFVDPVTNLIADATSAQLSEVAHKVFGGVGLPYSESTPERLKTMQQKPIALDAGQSGMSPMEGNVFLAAVMPGVFASVLGVLTETRKRLGTEWAERMVKKAEAGELKILDAGGAGVGILAVREVLRAEWERMHEENAKGNVGLAEVDGKAGGAGVSPPLGNATVLTGSDILRKRASDMLENTTFIPRLPDYLHTEQARLEGKFDIIIAPHTLWPLREDYMRKAHAQNLWSLLSNNGGVLMMLEKGVSRGFEMIAGARDMLLERHISSPGDETRSLDLSEPAIDWEGGQSAATHTEAKETGMIIAPCTNHTTCPMYHTKGKVKARKDICHFKQRYIRPPFLQRILKARDKNFEDVKFSYLSVMRGRDLRSESGGSAQTLPITQSASSTTAAFEGYSPPIFQPSTLPPDPSDIPPASLSLPRLILPPLKRTGHVIMDVCTPAGTLERWTVTRSSHRQGYRDARKAGWGDLWAMGAKSRVERDVRIGKHARREMMENAEDLDGESGKLKEGKGKGKGKGVRDGPDVDEYGHLVFKGKGKEGVPSEGGKMRSGKKIKGIRDKRDKKGTGNGRKVRRGDYFEED